MHNEIPYPQNGTLSEQPIDAAELAQLRQTIRRLEEAFAEYGALTGIDWAPSAEFYGFDGDEILFHYEEYWSRGGYEHHRAEMPLRFLLDREAWQAEHEAAEAAKQQAAAERKRTQAAERERKERVELERLAAKHGLALVGNGEQS